MSSLIPILRCFFLARICFIRSEVLPRLARERTFMFTNDYRIINLKYEYEGYTGSEKWAIITSLSEKELLEKYADILESHSPYILLTIEQGNAIDEYQRNEAKHRMRSLRCGHAFDITDGEFEVHHPEFAVCEDIVEQIDKEDKIKRLRDILNSLPEVQKRRLIKHFFYNKSSREIAKEEGVYYSAVDKSIVLGVEKIKKLF